MLIFGYNPRAITARRYEDAESAERKGARNTLAMQRRARWVSYSWRGEEKNVFASAPTRTAMQNSEE
jgi:hypothetical protein